MTPATRALDAAGIAYRTMGYEHVPGEEAYGREAARKLGLDPACVFKTLIVVGPDKALRVALVPALLHLDLKKLALELGVKHLDMAPAAQAERSSGYRLGAISPVGQKRALPTLIDESALRFEEIAVSGGRRGMDIVLAPADLVTLLGARFAPIAKA
ncbi:MAG: Cys-tRNA(Pro) deacylase [Lysobacteraceae bacterium]